MAFTITFHHILSWASPPPASPPDCIGKQLEDIKKTIMDLKTELLAAAAAEKEELLAGIETTLAAELAKRGLSDTEKAEVVAAIRGIYTQNATPTEGIRLELGFFSKGGETVRDNLVYEATPETTNDLLRDRISTPVETAVAIAPAGGFAVEGAFVRKVNGVVVSETKFTDASRMLHGQRATLAGLLSIVEDQIAALALAPEAT